MVAPSPSAPNSPARPAERVLAICLLLLLPLILVGPSLLPGKRFLPLAPVALEPLAQENPQAATEAWIGVNYLASDALFPVLSDAARMSAAIRSGELPLWDASTALGAPLFAQSMFGALYPLHWLAFVLDPDVALGWIALLDLFLAGAGLYCFARQRSLSFGAGLIGAAVFQTAGFACANLHDLMKVEAALWLPWALLAIDRVLLGERRYLSLLTLSVGLSFLAGFVPIAIFCAAAAAAYGTLRCIEMPAARPRIGRPWLGIGLGVALASIQLLPMAEAHRESSRSPRRDAIHAADGLPLASSLTLVAPELFGRADEAVFAPGNSTAWWLARASERELALNVNLLEWNLFAGALALSLAAAAIFARPRAAWFPAGLALLALGFAQGWPAISWLRALPGFDLGSPARAGAVAWIAWAWLAALGADALLNRERRVWLALTALAALCALGLAFAFGLDPAHWSAHMPERLAQRFSVTREVVDQILSPAELARGAERVQTAGLALAGFACLGLLCAIGALRSPGGARPRSAWIALFVVVGAEGAFYGRVHLAPRATGPELWPTSPRLDALRTAAGDGRVLRFDESQSGVGDVLDLARPNLPQAYGVADLSPYVVFTPRRSVELWSAVDPSAVYRGGISRISSTDLLDHPVLDVLRVTAILSRRPLQHPRLTAELESEGYCVYRRVAVPPRARVVTGAIRAPGDSAVLGVLAARLSKPERQTVLEFDAPPWDLEPTTAVGSVEITESRAGRVSIRTKDTPRGWLVLADAWYPGWRATVDGQVAKIVVADHALRAVALEAGEHRIEFEYAPTSLRWGGLLSALALLLTIVFSWRRSSPRPVS